MEKTRVGIIGSGFIGPAHIEALRRLPSVEVVALAESTPELARRKAEKLGISRAYGSISDLIGDPEVDVIHNCAPNHLHYEATRLALEAGKHVVSEKPLAMSSRQSAELIALAAKTGRKHAVCFNYTCYPLVQQCRAMVDQGELGRINLITGGYLQDWLAFDTDYNWRLEPEVGGESRAVADIGSHWCAVVQFATGLSITEVFADMATVIPVRKRPSTSTATFGSATDGAALEEVPIRTEDYASVLFKLSNGGRGVFTVSQVSHGCKNKLSFRLDGAQASVAWDQERPNTLWIGRRSAANGELLRDPGLLHPQAREYVSMPGGHNEGWPDGLKNLFRAFYADVRGERHGWYPTFAEGHGEMLLVEAVLKSAKEGRWVRVGETF